MEKVFFPLNISYAQKYTRSNRFFLIFIGVVLLIGLEIAAIVIYSSNVYVNFLGTVPMLVAMLIVGFLIGMKLIRVIGIGERKVLKMYKEMVAHEITTIEDLWNINAIENKRIHCFDMSTRVIIKCNRGYTLNRPKDFMQEHTRRLAEFKGSLCNNEYDVNWFNLKIPNANDKPLKTTEENIRSLKNSKLKTIGNAYLRTLRSCITDKSTSVVDYFVISTKDPQLASHIMQAVETACQYLTDSWYSSIEVLDKSGIVEFTENLMKIKGINVNDLRFGKVGDEDCKVLKLLYFIDGDNNEVHISNVNKVKNKTELSENTFEDDDIDPMEFKKFYSQLHKIKSDEDVVRVIEDDVIPVTEDDETPTIGESDNWQTIVIDDDEEI